MGLCPDLRELGVGSESCPKGVGGWVCLQTQGGWGLGPSVSEPKMVWVGVLVRIQGGWTLGLCPDQNGLGFGFVMSGPKGVGGGFVAESKRFESGCLT